MLQLPFSKKTLLITAFLSSIVVLLVFFSNYFNSQTRIVFCDVGQGDGTYIRIKNRIDILVDAGPDRKILECLGKYMPFYDRTIEIAIISHQQKDHFGGFLYILDRYDIKKLWTSQIYNSSLSMDQLLDKIDTKNVTIEFPKTRRRVKIFDAVIEFFWPSDGFITKNSFVDSETPALFRQTGMDLNNFSLIFFLEVDGVRILFTGDATPLVLSKLLNLSDGRQDKSKIKTQILKIPHHGSKNGLTVEFLKLADPTYGVISVGKNNSHGHPSLEILDMLEAQQVKIRRTDIEGDVVFRIKGSI